MRISGFSFIRNGIKLHYPFVESISSILPICDEIVIAVGNCSDGTREAISRIAPEKIRIIDTVWNDSMRQGGYILAEQTNIALDAITGDWGFYLQGDEVIHENDLPEIVKAAEKYHGNDSIEGLLFKWFHFFGNYDYIAKPLTRGNYPFEVRLIRNDKSIRSFRDAQGFRKSIPGNPRKFQHLRVKKLNASVYHYAKVRGPEAELERALAFHRLWHDDEWLKSYKKGKGLYNYDSKFPLMKFNGSHPAVMSERIASTNWNFIPESVKLQIPVKYRLLNRLQSFTGWRPFEFRNYKIV